MSLAGLYYYYYFESKEKLLYVIQMDLFVSVMDLIRERLKDESDPEQRVRIFIHTHLEYFLANLKSMKVLSHEDDVLTGELGKEITGLKRQYTIVARIWSTR
jgi:AcrR family transcriptional regulator